MPRFLVRSGNNIMGLPNTGKLESIGVGDPEIEMFSGGLLTVQELIDKKDKRQVATELQIVEEDGKIFSASVKREDLPKIKSMTLI